MHLGRKQPPPSEMFRQRRRKSGKTGFYLVAVSVRGVAFLTYLSNQRSIS
jgi:hypothetical protein